MLHDTCSQAWLSVNLLDVFTFAASTRQRQLAVCAPLAQEACPHQRAEDQPMAKATNVLQHRTRLVSQSKLKAMTQVLSA